MKTGIMILKATLVITLFASIPQLVAMFSGETAKPITYYNYEDSSNWDSYEADASQPMEEKKIEEEEANEAIEQHPLIGYWYVAYEELEVGVTYEFRREGEVIKAYSIEIYDKDENKMEDNTLTMTVNSFSGGKGSADYFMQYDGEKYQVESQLELVGNTLEVTYSYSGYDGKEQWEKITE